MASKLSQLVSIISEKVLSLDTYLGDNGLDYPSFAPDAPIELSVPSKEINDARWQAIDALLELTDLLQGPVSCIIPQVNTTSLQVILRREIAQKVPLHGMISFEELAETCRLDVVTLKRIIRYAITFHHVFTEPEPGFVGHSAGSTLLATDDTARAGVWQQVDDVYRGFARTADALDKFSGQKPDETGYALGHDTKATMFDYLRTHPEHEQKYSKAMTFYPRGLSSFSTSHIVQGYDWASLATGTIVDVGGSDGSISKALAAAHPKLSFVVQDLEAVVAPHQNDKTNMPPAEVSPQVTYQSYDFFTPQPTVADAYLFRAIFHNWPDHYVIQILRNQIPALKRGARIIVNENLYAEPGFLPLALARRVQYLDMTMLTVANSRLRTPDEWRELFAVADQRFGSFRHWRPAHSVYDILEVVWLGDEKAGTGKVDAGEN